MLVAVSGGSDSVALFHILYSLTHALSIRELGIAHVNHGLRGEESDAEELFVRELAKAHDCPFYSRRLDDAPEHGIEEWARTGRYRFFQHLRAKFHYDWIATGHTQDDQVETVLMRILRGTGITGLQGIHAVREDKIMRPVLSIGRDALRAYLAHRGIQWCEDSSNRDLKFSRNKIRHTLIPVLREQSSRGIEHIAQLARHAEDYVTLLEPVINNWIKDHVVTYENHFRIHKDGFAHPQPLIREACVKLFRFYGISFSNAHIQKIIHLSTRRGGQFLFPSKWRCEPLRFWLLFHSSRCEPETPGDSTTYELFVPGSTRCADLLFQSCLLSEGSFPELMDQSNTRVYLDAGRCGEKLLYRAVKKDDTFTPLGSEKSRNVLDYLKSRQVPAGERSRLGVVTSLDGTILWIPTVEISRKARVNRQTKSILEISCRYLSQINVF